MIFKFYLVANLPDLSPENFATKWIESIRPPPGDPPDEDSSFCVQLRIRALQTLKERNILRVVLSDLRPGRHQVSAVALSIVANFESFNELRQPEIPDRLESRQQSKRITVLSPANSTV